MIAPPAAVAAAVARIAEQVDGDVLESRLVASLGVVTKHGLVGVEGLLGR